VIHPVSFYIVKVIRDKCAYTDEQQRNRSAETHPQVIGSHQQRKEDPDKAEQ
jgi:hypothetical protein